MSAVLTVLISAAAACGVTTILAALLLVAERFLANFGACHIEINAGEKSLEVTGGETLLATLKGQGIFIPSACGGRGTCAYCKLKVSSGGGPLMPTETPLLTADEIARNVRISCQVKVRNDLAIEIPRELFAIREYRGVVEKIRDLTHDIKELRIRLVEPATISFVPGQYVQLETPAYGKNPESVYRAYSMSSPPSDDTHIETIVRLVPGGICTTWIFTMLKEGDEVVFNGPHGEFHLSDSGADMIWIAGGSGMAPFWSIIRHMKQAGLARPCRYYFGAVTKADLFLVDELRQMEKDLPWFSFVPALSGNSAEDGWDGERGLITEIVDRHVNGADGHEAYLCGGPGMIDAAIEVLKKKGIPPERIFFDKFG